MIAVGFLVFSWLLFRNPQRKNIIPDDVFLNTIFVGLVAGIAGGRLFYVLQHWDLFAENPLDIFLPWIGGLVLLGSITLVAISIPVFLWWKRVAILPTLDIAALYAPLFESIARFGCFFAGCCHGCAAPAWMPWAVTFTNEFGVAPLNVPLHPSQVYTSIAMLIVFGLMFVLKRYFKKAGQLAFSYLVFENTVRFTIDFWRGDQETFISFFGDFVRLSSSQVLSFKGFVVSLICLACVSFRKQSK